MKSRDRQPRNAHVVYLAHLKRQLMGQKTSYQVGDVPYERAIYLIRQERTEWSMRNIPSSQLSKNGNASPSHDRLFAFSRTCLHNSGFQHKSLSTM